MIGSFFKAVIIFYFLTYLSQQKCFNNSDVKYDLQDPAQITHYYSACSSFTKRTCCSVKNLDTLVKKIKKATESINISPQCKSTISELLCLSCDGDWGQGLYDGVCGSQCLNLYQNCKYDLFMLDPNNNKLKSCKQQDLFCWKLQDIANHFKFDLLTGKGQSKICQLFGILGAEYEGDCWYGQISSIIKGKGKRKIDYTMNRRPKTKKLSWWERNMKQIIYTTIIGTLALVFLYKFCKPTRPRYYRLN